jgi:hypothetical protein
MGILPDLTKLLPCVRRFCCPDIFPVVGKSLHEPVDLNDQIRYNKLVSFPAQKIRSISGFNKQLR